MLPSPPPCRRERRRAERSAHRRRRVDRLARLVQPGAALVVATGFLAGAVTGVAVEQSRRDRAQAEQVAAREVAVELAARVAGADAARLAGQAAAWSAYERTQALAAAQSAVVTAQTVAAQAGAVVDPATLGPLDEAVVALTALVAATPLDVVAVAVPEPVREEPAPPAPAPTEPGSDALVLLAAAADPATDRAVEPTTDAVTLAPTASAGSVPLADTAAGRLRDTVSRSLATRGPLSADPTTVDPTSDRDRSAQVVAAANEVLALSAQVQVATDAALAAAAQAAAEEAARAAAAQALAERVTRVEDAPNGAVPLDLLCGVDFDDDVLLRCDAATALEELDAAYRAASGKHLDVVSSYRDLAAQGALRATKGGLAGLPGTSNHGRAVAVDLAGTGSLGQFDAPLYLWLKAHADEHGWEHPAEMEPGGAAPAEPWHWEYVG